MIEHTCYCALPLDQLDAYRDAVWGLLRPGGRLLGAFLFFDDAGGPGLMQVAPGPAALLARFGGRFQTRHLQTAPEAFRPRGVPQLEVVFEKVD
ncbi:MAG: hypothetical protein R3F60_02975 [bacterium]